jgi:hypothetical protein
VTVPDDLRSCFLCKVDFKDNDCVVEFFGGFAHFDCFDKKMEDNKRREAQKKDGD